MLTDMIGWASAFVLLLTVSSQVVKQWRSRSSAGVSKWLFIGQISASLGFVIYSFAVENWVFVATNSFLLVTAAFGQFLYLRNKHSDRRTASAQPNAQSNEFSRINRDDAACPLPASDYRQKTDPTS